MPEGYMVRDAVQSGQAFAPILAEIEYDRRGRAMSVKPRPVMLIMEEWTVLLKNAGIPGSTLFDTVNRVFQGEHPWNISRSDRPGSGGGDINIPDPTLTILATTTGSLLREYMSTTMIRSGFLNRYLVLPGTRRKWKFYDPERAGVDFGKLHGLFDSIPTNPNWSNGANIWDMYTPAAKERLIAWGIPLLEPIMESEDLVAASMKRLHFYAHLVAVSCAYWEGKALADLSHVEMGIAIADISKKFVEELMGTSHEPDVPRIKAYEVDLEQKVKAKVKEVGKEGISRRDVVRDLSGKKATSADIYSLISKLVIIGVLEEKEEGKSQKVVKLFWPKNTTKK